MAGSLNELAHEAAHVVVAVRAIKIRSFCSSLRAAKLFEGIEVETRNQLGHGVLLCGWEYVSGRGLQSEQTKMPERERKKQHTTKERHTASYVFSACSPWCVAADSPSVGLSPACCILAKC